MSMELSISWCWLQFLSTLFNRFQGIGYSPLCISLPLDILIFWSNYKWDCFLNLSFCGFIISVYKCNRFLYVDCTLWLYWIRSSVLTVLSVGSFRFSTVEYHVLYKSRTFFFFFIDSIAFYFFLVSNCCGLEF